MQYIFVRYQISRLDACDAFEAPRWQHNNKTFIDFQLVKDGNDRPLSELLSTNLSGSRRVHNMSMTRNRLSTKHTSAIIHHM